MICVSLAERSLGDYLTSLERVDFAEIRLDRSDLTTAEVRELFSAHPRLIATCRPGPLTDNRRKELLLTAIDAGAAYVDIEVESEKAYRKEVAAKARSRRCTVIVSFHDYEKTPDRAALEAALTACIAAGAAIVKIACTVRSDEDNARLLGLLDRKERIVVVGMGARGRIVRIVAPLLGSPFTFASAGPGRETAEGQIDREKLLSLMRSIGGEEMEEVFS
jgi:3-dehydroquinate dehydratase I